MPKKYREIEVKRLVNEAQEDGASEAGWMATMADMMTLLLTFFIMLLALSSPDTEKYLGSLSEVGAAMGGKSLVEKNKTNKENETEKMKKRFQKLIQDNNLVKDVDITSDTRGLVLYGRGDFFFQSGQVEILPETRLFLSKVADVIREYDGDVLVEGHTDDVPIKSVKYPSNWELSTGRAASVVRYLIEVERIDPKRLYVAGYGEFKPRYTVKPENRAKNRRIEIVILRKK